MFFRTKRMWSREVAKLRLQFSAYTTTFFGAYSPTDHAQSGRSHAIPLSRYSTREQRRFLQFDLDSESNWSPRSRVTVGGLIDSESTCMSNHDRSLLPGLHVLQTKSSMYVSSAFNWRRRDAHHIATSATQLDVSVRAVHIFPELSS